MARPRVRRRAPPGRARRAGASARPTPVPVEVGEVGEPHRPAGRRRTGLLGNPRLPRLRRPVARAAVRRRLNGRLSWQAARLVASRTETATARTLAFEVAGWPGHAPGQHVDVRLTAEDGYSAQRSYSLAAPTDGNRLELTV